MEEGVIEYSGNLKNLQIESLLIKKVSEQIKSDFPNLLDIKFNIELIGEICNCIEDIVKSQKLKRVNKLDLFFKVHDRIFGMISEPERKLVIQVIDYLHSNDKIKVRPFFKKVIRFVSKLVRKN